jgi:uncharacterized Fe-S cluster protein YjdI
MSDQAPKTYTNGEITVTWEPAKCTHSGNCVRGLGAVFQPREKPWIKIDAASSQAIADQVDRCPSGALGWYRNGEGPSAEG